MRFCNQQAIGRSHMICKVSKETAPQRLIASLCVLRQILRKIIVKAVKQAGSDWASKLNRAIFGPSATAAAANGSISQQQRLRKPWKYHKSSWWSFSMFPDSRAKAQYGSRPSNPITLTAFIAGTSLVRALGCQVCLLLQCSTLDDSVNMCTISRLPATDHSGLQQGCLLH